MTTPLTTNHIIRPVFSAVIIAKYEVLTVVLLGFKSPGILRSVDVRVVIDVSKDRTVISKVKKTNVVNCLTLKVKAFCFVENSGLSNDE